MIPFEHGFVLFGGGGPYIERIKRRETFNDLYFYDTKKREWLDLKKVSDDARENHLSIVDGETKPLMKNLESARQPEPCKRMSHAAAILGNCLIVHGGIYGEDNKMLDDMNLYDFGLKMWIDYKQPKSNRAVKLGVRAMHTMTYIGDPTISPDVRWTRLQWVTYPPQECEQSSNLLSIGAALYVFGGIDPSKKVYNTLHKITPAYEKNRKIISTTKGGAYKQLVKPKMCFEINELQPHGRPPCPRYMHAACAFKHYLAIFGGRCD